jgi:hypothetical protein
LKVRLIELEEKLMTNLKSMDGKIVQLRKDTDVDTFLRMIRQKADSVVVNSDLKNHEFKISHIDTNVMRMATDFDVLQETLYQTNIKVSELCEVNKDVLLGKRRINCLSCGNDSSAPNG